MIPPATKKSFLKISFVSTGNIFNAGLGFVFLTAVARSLPLQDFGKYALLTTLLVGLAKIMDFGTNSLYVTQSIITPKQNKDIFLSTKVILFIISLIVSVITLYLLHLTSATLIILFTLGLLAYGINFTLFALFQRHEKFNFVVLINTIPATIKTLFAILIFASVITPTLNLTFGVFALSIFGSLALYIFLPDKNIKLAPDLKESQKLILQAAPAGITQITNEGWPAILNSAAKITSGFANAGIFSVANKIAQIFSLISLSIFTVLLPRNAQRKKDRLKYNVSETVLLAAGILTLSVTAMFISKTVVLIVFGNKFTDSLGLLNILILASGVTAIHTFMENFFFVEKKVELLLIVTLTKLGVFLTLTLVLVPLLSLQGLSLAYLIAAISALLVTGLSTLSIKKVRH